MTADKRSFDTEGSAARTVAQPRNGVHQGCRHQLMVLHAHLHGGERAPCVLRWVV